KYGKDNHPAKDAEITKELYDMSKEDLTEGVKRFRNLSSQVYQNIQVIPCYRILELFGIVRKRKVLYEVSTQLIEFGNTTDLFKTIECQYKIAKVLNLKHLIQAAEERENR